MKKLVFIVFFIFAINYTFGQSIVWEILNLGYSFGLTKDDNGNGWNANGLSGTLSLGSELRIKFLDNRLSSGLQFSFSGWNRFDPDGNSVGHQFAFSYMALCDYNFLNVHPKITPFAGIGVGLSSVTDDAVYDPRMVVHSFGNRYNHFAFSPRVGIEYKHVRLALDYKYLGNRNNYFTVRVGYVIGS